MSIAHLLSANKIRIVWLAFSAVTLLAGVAVGQPTKRCDQKLNNTQTPIANSVCLDLLSDTISGPLIQAPSNATRIAYNGLKFCKNAFSVTDSGEADVVFIMDNTGSMQWGDPHFCSVAGDPTFYRDDAIRRGMKSLQDSARQATAGFISFKGPDTTGINRYQSLLDITKTSINGAANLATLQSKVIADSGRKPPDTCNRATPINTDWYPSFNLALKWLANPAMAKSPNQAIVLISDGAVDDYLTNIKPLVLAGRIPPVYGIHLGAALDNQGRVDQASSQLQELSELTGGKFFRVPPADSATMKLVMDTIIKKLVSRPIPPKNLTIRSVTTGQLSTAKSSVPAADGNYNITLDSSLALQQSGVNNFEVTITSGFTKVRPLRIQANGPVATVDALGVSCYDPAVLSATAAGVGYKVTLTHSPSELTSVTVKGTSIDISRPGWGDAESINLASSSSPNINAFNQTINPFPFNGTTANPRANNGTLETDQNGNVYLRCVHPRDPRDSALYEIPLGAGAVDLVRLVDVAQGVNISGPVTNPIVIYRGVGYVPVRYDSTTITAIGTCVYNCNSVTNAPLSPGQSPAAPSFAFKSRIPFRFSLYVYDNLGRFVNKAVDSVKASDWLNGTDNGSVVISMIPVSQDGQQLGTGVYILKAAITTTSAGTTVTSRFQKQFGYKHP